MTNLTWGTFPYLELLCILLTAVGAGYSLNGWITASQDEAENRLLGLNGSIAMAARWRVHRERSRFVDQMIILVGRLIVLLYLYRHPDLIISMTIYVTGNASFVLLSWRLLLYSINDRSERSAISAEVKAEHRRATIGGRRITDVSAARMEGVLAQQKENGKDEGE